LHVTDETVGSYRLLEKLGEGGMGEVYSAEHKYIERRAAIKFLLPELTGSSDLVGRFFAEARAASVIKHPGIVEVLDCDVQPDGRAYIVMELLDGESLRD
jgi:serine/threonine protein kinase